MAKKIKKMITLENLLSKKEERARFIALPLNGYIVVGHRES